MVAGNVPSVMARTFETVKAATGIDMAEIARADTYDAKVNRNLSVNGLPDSICSASSADNSPDVIVTAKNATVDIADDAVTEKPSKPAK